MRIARDLGALAFILAASALVNMYYFASPARSWDETTYVKGSLHPVCEFTSEAGYEYAIDHPALKRYIYGFVLHACGITKVHVPDVDYAMGQEWNIEHGHLPQMSVILPLRATNAVFITATVLTVFFTAFACLGNGPLSALVALPLVFSERIASGAVAYVGCDSFLAFLLALSLFLLVVFARAGKASTLWGVVILGVIGGLATSAKLNGALAVVAVMVYLAVFNRGVDRFFRPFLAGSVAVAVFVALNPVMRGGGLGWTFGVLWDIISRREYIWESQYQEFSLSRVQLVALFFPYAAFVYALAAGAVILRRARWVAPLLIWTAVVVLGTLFTVNRTYDRYFLPVQMGAFSAGGIVAWALFMRFGPSADAVKRAARRMWAPVATALAAAAVLVAVLSAWAPWGPSRLRLGLPPARKAEVFFRQAAAFYRMETALAPKEVASILDWQQRGEVAAEAPLPKQLFSTLTRRVVGWAFFVAGLFVVYLAGRRILQSRWLAAALLVPFIWSDFAQGDFWLHSASECLLVFFTGLTLYFWIDTAFGEGAPSLARTVLLAALAGGVFASAPRGALLAGAVAAFFISASRGWGRLGRAALAVAASAISFLVLEPLLWYLGASDTLRFAQSMYSGVLVHWTQRFSETSNILIPLRECFPYWPLVPLGAVALAVVRRERWAAVLGFYGAAVLAAVLVGLPASAAKVYLDVRLALAVCAGAPALVLLERQVRLAASLAEPSEENVTGVPCDVSSAI